MRFPLRAVVMGFALVVLLATGSRVTTGNTAWTEWQGPTGQLGGVKGKTETSPFAAAPESTAALRLKTAAGVRLVSVAVTPPIGDPGHYTADLTVRTTSGKLLSQSRFPTGHRLAVTFIEKAVAPNRTEELICLRVVTSPTFGPTVRSEYFALSSEKPVLVRLEDDDGRATRDYFFPHFFGPDPLITVPMEKVDREARRLLAKGTWAERLAILTWLAATHEEDHGGRIPYRRGYRPIVRKLRADPEILRLLADLRQSKDPWTREYALLAATNPRFE